MPSFVFDIRAHSECGTAVRVESRDRGFATRVSQARQGLQSRVQRDFFLANILKNNGLLRTKMKSQLGYIQPPKHYAPQHCGVRHSCFQNFVRSNHIDELIRCSQVRWHQVGDGLAKSLLCFRGSSDLYPVFDLSVSWYRRR